MASVLLPSAASQHLYQSSARGFGHSRRLRVPRPSAPLELPRVAAEAAAPAARRFAGRRRLRRARGFVVSVVAAAGAVAGAAVALDQRAPERRRSHATKERLDWLKHVEGVRARNTVAVRCRQILLASEPLADEVRQEVRRTPEAFDELAKKLSLCVSTASSGGDIGWLGKEDAFLDDLVPGAVREAALAGQPGDILKVSTALGWHVVRIEDVMLDLRIQRLGALDAKGVAVADGFATQDGTYQIETMGCQMNKADSERMAGQLSSLGLTAASSDDAADPSVVVLNTCSIRDKAEQKVYAKLDPFLQRKRRGDDMTIVVSGCVAQQEGEALLQAMPEIDVVVGPQYANRLADVLHAYREGGGSPICVTEEARIMEDVTMPNRQSAVAAWVNVIYGCNERCSYCVVPYTRGSEQSRPMESVRRELSQLAAEGFREVTLLGQNIDAWGHDLNPRRNFADLLRYVGDVEGIERVRFLTSHPRYISQGLVDAVRDTPAVCEQFHIPFQSGSDEVLARMERGYTAAHYLRVVDRIRTAMPDAGISADAIVGFPGETDKQFEETLALMRAVGFDTVNTASYSPRPNTPAATWPDQVPEEVKRERLRRINELAAAQSLERLRALLGTEVEVLVEGRNLKRPSQVRGRTRGGRMCFLEGGEELIGRLVRVRVTDAYTFSIGGCIVGEPR